jgi:hypothetical protein
MVMQAGRDVRDAGQAKRGDSQIAQGPTNRSA